MDVEDKNTDYKSIRLVQTGDAGFHKLAQACVCFANAQGGKLIIGIEDKDKLPPANQRISVELVNQTLNRLRSLCFGVAVASDGIMTHSNGSNYFVVQVFPSLKAIATTSDGKIYIRRPIRFYDPQVIRELLINAFAHKSYTISGDLFISVWPDRLEISNPGGLPTGITKDNILHRTARRNPHLIRVFHDLNLMEGEGSGYDLLYEISSRDAKPFPDVRSEYDRTTVVQYSQILHQETVILLDFVSSHYTLSQREFIALGIIARHQKVLTTQLSKELQLAEEERIRPYVSRLLEQGIVISRGVRKGTEYLVNPKLIVNARINVKPTLKVIERHHLKALIVEELKLRPESTINDIHKQFGEIAVEDIRKAVYSLVSDGILDHSPGKTYRTYWLAKKNRNEIEI